MLNPKKRKQVAPTRKLFSRWRDLFLLGILCSWLLSACQPGLTPVPLATPQVMTIQVTPTLQNLGADFSACTSELQNTGLVVIPTPADAINLDRSPLALRWGLQTQPTGYAADLGQETLVMIVSPSNSVQQLSQADLQGMYQGKIKNWPGNGPEVQAWTYPSGEDTTQVFESVVMGGTSVSNRNTYTAPDPAAMLEAISKNAGAVGYIPRRWLNSSVKAVTISGIPEAQMSQPVVGLSKSEPTGPEKSWLLCLQDRLKNQ